MTWAVNARNWSREQARGSLRLVKKIGDNENHPRESITLSLEDQSSQGGGKGTGQGASCLLPAGFRVHENVEGGDGGVVAAQEERGVQRRAFAGVDDAVVMDPEPSGVTLFPLFLEKSVE